MSNVSNHGNWLRLFWKDGEDYIWHRITNHHSSHGFVACIIHLHIHIKLFLVGCGFCSLADGNRCSGSFGSAARGRRGPLLTDTNQSDKMLILMVFVWREPFHPFNIADSSTTSEIPNHWQGFSPLFVCEFYFIVWWQLMYRVVMTQRVQRECNRMLVDISVFAAVYFFIFSVRPLSSMTCLAANDFLSQWVLIIIKLLSLYCVVLVLVTKMYLYWNAQIYISYVCYLRLLQVCD